MYQLDYVVTIESDDKIKARYMVVIKKKTGELVGTPMRGVLKKEAQLAVRSIIKGFEYGVEACRICLTKQLAGTYHHIKYDPTT